MSMARECLPNFARSRNSGDDQKIRRNSSSNRPGTSHLVPCLRVPRSYRSHGHCSILHLPFAHFGLSALSRLRIGEINIDFVARQHRRFSRDPRPRYSGYDHIDPARFCRRKKRMAETPHSPSSSLEPNSQTLSKEKRVSRQVLLLDSA